MAWSLIGTVGFRVLYVWLYNNTGKSVFGVILCHAIGNTGRNAFPGGRPSSKPTGPSVTRSSRSRQ